MIHTFRRYEKKYLITAKQATALFEKISDRMKPDEYGETVICNLYYDTPDFLLIRRSTSLLWCAKKRFFSIYRN